MILITKYSEVLRVKNETETPDESVATKKPRFAEVAEEDINKLLDDAQASKTKANTKWAVSVFNG